MALIDFAGIRREGVTTGGCEVENPAATLT